MLHSLNSKTNVHNEEIGKLYEEMESQIRIEKNRVLAQVYYGKNLPISSVYLIEISF